MPDQDGPVYDRAMRRLAENGLAAFCGLLGVTLEDGVPDAARLLPATFAGTTQTADLVVRVGPRRLLHVEYQRRAEDDLPMRMLGYRAAIMRAHPGVEVGQWVVVLGEGTVGSIDHGGFRLGCRVLYLRDVPVHDFYAQTEGGRFLIDRGREQGREQGREEAREEAVAVLLRERFGDDPRIPGVAHRLAAGDLATAYRSVLASASLDDLDDRPADL